MQTTNRISGAQPSNNPFASASLYVGDLAAEVTEATLFELFNAVGPVASIRVCRDATTRRSLGYAYVNFHSVQDAERALDTMNFTNIRGRQCRIMWSQRDPRLRQSGKGNIFVKHLHETIDNKTLYDTFSVFGNILSCKVVTDSNEKSRGYGYVHYVDDKSAKKAIEGVNGMTISDRKVHAELFKPREQRIKDFKYTNVYVKHIPKHWTEDILKKVFEEATGGKIDTSFMFTKSPFGLSACLNFVDPDDAKAAVDKLNGKDVSSFGVPEPEQKDEDEEKKETEAATDGADDESGKGKDATTDEENKADSNERAKGGPKETQPSMIPTKLYVARAQKKKERSEYLQRQQRRRGGTQRRNYTGANLYIKNLNPDVDDAKLHEMFASFGNITSAKVMREPNGKSRGFGFVAFEKKEAATRAIHEMTNTLHHGKPLYVSRAQTKAFRQTFIMKQLRNKRMRNNLQGGSGGMGGGSGYGGPPGYQGQGGYGGGRGQQGGGYGGPSYGGGAPGMGRGGPMGNPNMMGPQGFGMGRPPHQMQFAGQMQMPYGITNPMTIQQQQQLAAQQLVSQQLAVQQRAQMASSGLNNPQLQAQLQQQQQLNQMASIQQAQTSMQMSSIQQQAAHQRSQSMGQTQQSQPAQSMQSGPQSTSMFAGSASIPRPGLTASQQMVASGAVASQPHQSSVPTGQHSVSQVSTGAGQTSAPMLEVNPLTAEMLQDAKPTEKKRLIGERLFPKIQVVEPRLAGKITGMLLEMDNTELLILLSDQRALMNKINEALAVLKDHQQKQSQQNPGSTKNPSSQNPAIGSAQN